MSRRDASIEDSSGRRAPSVEREGRSSDSWADRLAHLRATIPLAPHAGEVRRIPPAPGPVPLEERGPQPRTPTSGPATRQSKHRGEQVIGYSGGLAAAEDELAAPRDQDDGEGQGQSPTLLASAYRVLDRAKKM